MRVLSEKTINEFSENNAQAREELRIWFRLVRLANWPDFNALKADMPATDYVRNDRYVFNIKGNHYRLVAMIFFAKQRLYIRGIYTHAEYSKISREQIKNL